MKHLLLEFKLKITLSIVVIFATTNCGFAQSSITVDGAGWKKIAYNNLTSGRGFGKVTLYTTGGKLSPQFVDIYWYKDWLNSNGIRVETASPLASYWTDARLTYSSDTLFIEVKFNTALDKNIFVIIDQYGWNPAKPFTGTLPQGGATTVGKTVKISRLSIEDQIVLDFNGHVGIGTNTPTDLLSVNGMLRAKEVKVEATNWPDYVFKEEYKPLSLEAIEEFINANGHLPEIPSAKVVENEGILLSEINVMLLKKIEELTLHLINKNKEIKSLDERLIELERNAIDNVSYRARN